LNELIKISFENERITVSARELHEFLEIKKDFSDWIKTYTENDSYGFEENVDYTTFKGNCDISTPRARIEYILTTDMAKELCMLSKVEKGKQVRKYFIEVEKEFNSPEKVMARALKIADKTINILQLENKQQQQIIGELKPRADYTDRILQNKGLVTITQIAKDYGMSGNAMNELLHSLGVQYRQSNQWLLYQKYHDKGYTHSQTVDIVRKDGRPDVKMNTKWTQKGRLFIYNLLKENGTIPVIEKEQKKEA
jgi:anti-repressor protein